MFFSPAGKNVLNDSAHIATFSRNRVIFNGNILKVEKTGVYRKSQIIDNQCKMTEGGAPNLPPSVTNPEYTQPDQGRQLKVKKTVTTLSYK